MHILVTNDDGPPCAESSPYVHCLVRHLQRAGHEVSVCLPHTQRSWIGKAHMIGQTLKPLYYRPGSDVHGEGQADGQVTEGTTHHRPSPTGDVEEWILIDGTPASCVQIGLFHFFQDKGPIDLVLSGPNYGRNTSSVFALSSGTVGAALEAAVCKQRAIALSFAFFSRNHDPVVIEAACRHSIRVIEALCRRWPADGSVDLYSVNVPLVEEVESRRTLFTDMLQNYWRGGSCFQEIDGNTGDATEDEARIREGPDGEAEGAVRGGSSLNGARAGHRHKHFKWAPRLTDVFQSVEESAPGNDGRTVMEGNTSITPLKCNFAQAQGAFSRQELELMHVYYASPAQLSIDLFLTGSESSEEEAPEAAEVAPKSQETVAVVVAYEDAYVQPLIVSAFQSLIPPKLLNLRCDKPKQEYSSAARGSSKSVHVVPYEAIDFEAAAAHPQTLLINSYMIRKALIRKHFLSTLVDHWVAKRPESVLGRHVKRSEAFEVDYAEFLDDALVEAFDLRESLERNAQVGDAERREWWILKPGMSDRGQGIRLFSSMEELQGIFDGWEAERPDSDDKEEDGDAEEEEDEDGDADEVQDERPDGDVEEEEERLGRDADKAEAGECITASHLRHFVAQPYIHPPLLVESDARKFHIRTYVLAAGCLRVYVYRQMLALFAAKPYLAPWEHDSKDVDSYLTNTCRQTDSRRNAVKDGSDSTTDIADCARGTSGSTKDVADSTNDSLESIKDTADTAKDNTNSAKYTADPANDSSDSTKDVADSAKDTANSAKYTADSTNDSSHSTKDTTMTDSAKDTVRPFWSLPLPQATLDSIFAQICTVTGEVFEAGARAMPVHFQTQPNAFEVFGLDFLVDADATAWLLEVNAFPDFAQTGTRMQGLVQGLWNGVVREAVLPFCGFRVDGDTDMVLVKEMDLGRG